jgi:hypothetical protein
MSVTATPCERSVRLIPGRSGTRSRFDFLPKPFLDRRQHRHNLYSGLFDCRHPLRMGNLLLRLV